MALVKYNPAIFKPRKSSTGFTFSNTSRMNVSKPVAKIVHHRTPRQLNYKKIFIYLSQIWRSLNPSVKSSWSTFSNAIPQPTKFDDTKFLTPFQNFVRRNYYQFLIDGSFDNIMIYPNTTVYENDPAEFIPSIVDGRLLVDITFERSEDDLTLSLFVSSPVPSSVSFCGNNYRFMKCVNSVSQQIDITDEYLAAFHILPDLSKTNESMFFDYVNAAKLNGQLWFHTAKKRQQPNNFMGLYYRSDIVHYSKSIAADGWYIPQYYEMQLIVDAFEGMTGSSQDLREKGLTNWNLYSLPASNDSLLSFRGSGYYYPESDSWEEVKDTCYQNLSGYLFDNADCAMGFWAELPNIEIYLDGSLRHTPLRVCRFNYDRINGQTGFYTGNDGKVYETITWNYVEMITSNLAETKFSDGSDIPIVQSGVEFLASEIPAAVYLNYTPPV